MSIAITYIGTATMLLEVEGQRILTDPAFDAAGRHYSFGFGTGSTRTLGPAIPFEQIRAAGAIDAALLSHDQHADNLDDAGHALLPEAKVVLTTQPGARRLGKNARGLADWQSADLGSVRVTAVPARHGPRFSLPIVGKTIGFVLEWPGQANGVVYVSGDTVYFDGIRQISRKFDRVSIGVIHLGGVQFGISGPFRYTFDAPGAVHAVETLRPKTIVPVHYDGWSHFRESRETFARAFDAAGVSARVKWLEPGKRVELDV